MTTTEAGGAPPCAFARALLARQAGCPLATLALAGEAERPLCGSPVAHANCATFRSLVRERATFALRLPPPGAAITHANELRLQCGGLRGLAVALGGRDEAPGDVHALVAAAQARFDGLLGVPFEAVVAAVVGWEGRPRATGGGSHR
ncbi:MAG: hypothetical protein AB7P08_16995 [Burkholderiales bacterium]